MNEEIYVSNGEDKYTWTQVLNDIDLNNSTCFDSVKIGMIDVGVIDEILNNSEEYQCSEC